MPTKTGHTRPRGRLGLTSHVASKAQVQKARGKLGLKSTAVKSAKPTSNRVGRRER
jgi:hypothetical protein